MVKPATEHRTKRQSRRDNNADSKRKSATELRAYIVLADGLDEQDVRDQCAKSIPDWLSLSAADQAEIIRLTHELPQRSKPPRMTVQQKDGRPHARPADGDDVTLYALRLMEAMGSRSAEYGDDRLNALADYFQKNNRSGLTTEGLSASLAFIHGSKPGDPVQSSLLVQMAATHDAAMRALAMVGGAQMVEHLQAYGNLANKLLNTFSRQAEVLSKLQRGGEQVVKHVHIDNRNGQAIVTDHVTTGGVNGKSGDQAHATAAAVLGQDPFGNGVPIVADQGEETLQAARRAIDRGAEG